MDPPAEQGNGNGNGNGFPVGYGRFSPSFHGGLVPFLGSMDGSVGFGRSGLLTVGAPYAFGVGESGAPFQRSGGFWDGGGTASAGCGIPSSSSLSGGFGQHGLAPFFGDGGVILPGGFPHQFASHPLPGTDGFTPATAQRPPIEPEACSADDVAPPPTTTVSFWALSPSASDAVSAPTASDACGTSTAPSHLGSIGDGNNGDSDSRSISIRDLVSSSASSSTMPTVSPSACTTTSEED